MPATTGTFQYQPQWRAENQGTTFPFSESASLSNGAQFIPAGLFVDAVVHPVGGLAGLYLSAVVVAHDLVTVYVGDEADERRCSGAFDPLHPPPSLALSDRYGRPAGLLVAADPGLGFLAAWGAGTYGFKRGQTEFVASVCFPQPDPGVRGVRLPDGTVLAGEVWLVGDDGVVLRHETAGYDRGDGTVGYYEVVRVDVVGDPLFRRRLCAPADRFATPAFVRTVTFKDDRGTRVVCAPDAYGDVKMTVNNAAAADTVLRIRPSAAGNRIDVVGSTLSGVG